MEPTDRGVTHKPESGWRNGRNRAAVIVLVLAFAVPAHAGQDPWAGVRYLPAGTDLVIAMRSGADLKGRLELVAAEELLLTTKSGSQRRIPRTEIQTIRRLKADSVWNGALAGAALGFVGGSAVGAAWVHGSGRYGAKPPGYAREFITGVGVLGSVAGALAGWRMDAGRLRSEVIYDTTPAAMLFDKTSRPSITDLQRRRRVAANRKTGRAAIERAS